ncbi:hypothetical protein [Fluviispira vulneris]|nr:hypothetical protein [Fluviispira vulneris]
MKFIITVSSFFILFSTSSLISQSKIINQGEIKWVKEVREIHW